MAFFSFKISDPKSIEFVNAVREGSTDLEISQINQLESDLKEGEYVFIQLGGDKVSWDKGLIGLSQIIRAPYDKGYDKKSPRNFKLGLKMVLVMNDVIAREDLKKYVNAYDAGGIGPNTKGDQNQAIKAIEDIQAYTILRAMVEKQIDLEDKVKQLFDDQTVKAVFGPIPVFSEQEVSYDMFLASKRCSFKEYLASSLDKRKDQFVSWLQVQRVKEDGEYYKQKTAEKYASSLKVDANKLVGLELEEKNLFHYAFIDEYKKIIGLIENCENYDEIKNKANRVFNNALDKYYDFLLSMCEDVSKMTCLDIKLNRRERKRFPLNQILYGPPGTGKTYSAIEYAVAIANNIGLDELGSYENTLKEYKGLVINKRVVFTTFHQNYGYEEFIQGLRPDPEAEILKLRCVDGCFKTLADNALIHPENDYVIIIDEINRANISKVFGELITLIESDKRWGEEHEMCVTLQSGDVFAVPNNLYIVGTMNTADKSISLIDAALRRRFDFTEIKPDKNLIDDPDVQIIFDKMNKMLNKQLKSADLLIGHSFFMNKGKHDLEDIFNSKIIPLLYEYYYDQKGKVKAVLEEALKDYGEFTIVDDDFGRLKLEKKDDM